MPNWQPGRSSTKSVRILIVANESLNTKELESLLVEIGCVITGVVNSSQKAIEQANNNIAELVLMDIHLQGDMDGIEAAEIIQTRCGTPLCYSDHP